METTAIAPRTEARTTLGRLTTHEIIEAAGLIQDVMRTVMKRDHHYGLIPGCGDKPTLLKPGAEKLAMVFRLAPSFSIKMTDLGKGHREYEVVSTLTHIPTGDVFGQGVGCCSTMESKYRWRGGSRLCPECGKPTIKKSKYPPRNAPRDTPPGFYCFGKLGGCGVEFAHDDKRIVGQSEERQENPDIADTYNTVLKMAKKRAQIDATLTATGASDIFAQDLEDLAGKGAFDAVNGVATPDSAPSEAPPPSDDIPLAAEAGSAIGKPVSWKDVKENVLGYLNLADTKARAAADLRAACDRLKISRPSVKDITPDEWTALNKELPAPLKVDF